MLFLQHISIGYVAHFLIKKLVIVSQVSFAGLSHDASFPSFTSFSAQRDESQLLQVCCVD